MSDRRTRLPASLLPMLPLALIIGLALLFHLLPPHERVSPDDADKAVRYHAASFSDLPGWELDDPRPALAALGRSCALRLALSDEMVVGPRAVGGTVGDWRTACHALEEAEFADAGAARDFLTAYFRPFALSAGGRTQGLFTGYYEPLIEASTEAGPDYGVPIHRRPADLVSVDLGRFRDDYAGRSIAGRVVDGRLVPYASRAGIMNGALAGQGLEFLWARDPVAVFFLHIQGSGRVRLADGREQRIGYDGANGHPYRALGRLMAARGLIAPEALSAPAIAAWLRDHPAEGAALMAENPAYVFFRPLEGDGPVGSEGSVLTPGRSLAVDRAHLPLGAPVWLATSHPDPSGTDRQLPLRRLMVAQDSGSAITGAVRGDVFWGAGPDAGIIAGRMANAGHMWLLLPRALADRIAGEQS